MQKRGLVLLISPRWLFSLKRLTVSGAALCPPGLLLNTAILKTANCARLPKFPFAGNYAGYLQYIPSILDTLARDLTKEQQTVCTCFMQPSGCIPVYNALAAVFCKHLETGFWEAISSAGHCLLSGYRAGPACACCTAYPMLPFPVSDNMIQLRYH